MSWKENEPGDLSNGMNEMKDTSNTLCYNTKKGGTSCLRMLWNSLSNLLWASAEIVAIFLHFYFDNCYCALSFILWNKIWIIALYSLVWFCGRVACQSRARCCYSAPVGWIQEVRLLIGCFRLGPALSRSSLCACSELAPQSGWWSETRSALQRKQSEGVMKTGGAAGFRTDDGGRRGRVCRRTLSAASLVIFEACWWVSPCFSTASQIAHSANANTRRSQ